VRRAGVMHAAHLSLLARFLVAQSTSASEIKLGLPPRPTLCSCCRFFALLQLLSTPAFALAFPAARAIATRLPSSSTERSLPRCSHHHRGSRPPPPPFWRMHCKLESCFASFRVGLRGLQTATVLMVRTNNISRGSPPPPPLSLVTHTHSRSWRSRSFFLYIISGNNYNRTLCVCARARLCVLLRCE
jgi:hypothetical protein